MHIVVMWHMSSYLVMITAMLWSLIFMRDRAAYLYIKKHVLHVILIPIILMYATVRVGKIGYADTILLTGERSGAATHITDVAVRLTAVVEGIKISELSHYDTRSHDREAARYTHISGNNVQWAAVTETLYGVTTLRHTDTLDTVTSTTWHGAYANVIA